MLELINQLDGVDKYGNINVLMVTILPDTVDAALICTRRLDRKIDFGFPDMEGGRISLRHRQAHDSNNVHTH